MKNKYHLKWITYDNPEECSDGYDAEDPFFQEKHEGIFNFNDEELNKFIETHDKVKIQFICEVKDNPVLSLDWDDLYNKWLFSETVEGVDSESVKDFIKVCKYQLSKQNGVETNKEQPMMCECCKTEKVETAKGMCKSCSEYW